MSVFYGRRALLGRINDLQKSGHHVSVTGPRSIGKTSILRALVDQHQHSSALFSGAALVDLRHNPPQSTEEALRRVGEALQTVFRSASGGQFSALAEEVDLKVSAEELYDQLKAALGLIEDAKAQILLVLDGCDPVLQNSEIPRNLWDNLRALAQSRALRLVTGSRAPLHELCYNPEARTSDFFRIFYDEPLQVGPFDDADWQDVFAGAGLPFNVSAQKEMRNWTGGHPDLVVRLLARLKETGVAAALVGKEEVDEAADTLLASRSAGVQSLWLDCAQEMRGDIVQLLRGELPAADVPADRLRLLVGLGIATKRGTKLRLTNRFVEKLATDRHTDVSGARQLFEQPTDFTTNIRTVLELRIAQVSGADRVLAQVVQRAIRHLPEDAGGVLGSARDILDRALELVWAAEAPDGRVPKEWISKWQAMEATSGRKISNVAEYGRDSAIPDERGRQCALLRLATGMQRVPPVTSKVTKSTQVLIEHMNQLGDLKNHSRGEPSLLLAVAFSFTAIELCEALKRELG